uniref:Uncharacterized protein n=1 Tax=Physcomitrium patens TaxID=3218 RepID=A9RG49_PHYPA|nr:hypothetical protein PHYPA_002236 [Physcomitrium patens]
MWTKLHYKIMHEHRVSGAIKGLIGAHTHGALASGRQVECIVIKRQVVGILGNDPCFQTSDPGSSSHNVCVHGDPVPCFARSWYSKRSLILPLASETGGSGAGRAIGTGLGCRFNSGGVGLASRKNRRLLGGNVHCRGRGSRRPTIREVAGGVSPGAHLLPLRCGAWNIPVQSKSRTKSPRSRTTLILVAAVAVAVVVDFF